MPLRRAARDLFVPQHAEAKDVDERIAFVAFVEINLAADGRNADAIAVMRDARDDAGEQIGDCADLIVRLPDPLPIRRSARSAASSARNTGRAPIVKISRMIPPTPVAAPWNGSTALG